MAYKEIEYSESLWKRLKRIAKHNGDSLHCTEWIAIDIDGKQYRLTQCYIALKYIEEFIEE